MKATTVRIFTDGNETIFVSKANSNGIWLTVIAENKKSVDVHLTPDDIELLSKALRADWE